MVKKESKRAQVTIFIILAILIVAILIFAFFPNIKGIFISQTPEQMVPKSCVEKAIKNSLNETMLHGGIVNPELYFMYNNQSITYICYTLEWYKTCTMQIPLLKQQVEKETLKYSSNAIDACFEDMESKLEDSGYNVVVKGTRKANITLVPGKVQVFPDIQIIAEKNGDTSTLDKNQLNMEFNAMSYDIIMIASAIQDFEAEYGDSNPETYMALYPNIRIEKLKQSDGTKVYIISDRNTLEKMQFATRSLAWPPGVTI